MSVLNIGKGVLYIMSTEEEIKDTNTALDYYSGINEGKLYCIGGVDVQKKKALALKMRDMSLDCCPYVIIDSTNSRHFISHCVGYDVLTSINNNERIAEFAEMILKQGINMIILTARVEIVYLLLKNKISNTKIIDIAYVDLDELNNLDDLEKLWE